MPKSQPELCFCTCRKRSIMYGMRGYYYSSYHMPTSQQDSSVWCHGSWKTNTSEWRSATQVPRCAEFHKVLRSHERHSEDRSSLRKRHSYLHKISGSTSNHSMSSESRRWSGRLVLPIEHRSQRRKELWIVSEQKKEAARSKWIFSIATSPGKNTPNTWTTPSTRNCWRPSQQDDATAMLTSLFWQLNRNS